MKKYIGEFQMPCPYHSAHVPADYKPTFKQVNICIFDDGVTFFKLPKHNKGIQSGRVGGGKWERWEDHRMVCGGTRTIHNCFGFGDTFETLKLKEGKFRGQPRYKAK